MRSCCIAQGVILVTYDGTWWRIMWGKEYIYTYICVCIYWVLYVCVSWKVGCLASVESFESDMVLSVSLQGEHALRGCFDWPEHGNRSLECCHPNPAPALRQVSHTAFCSCVFLFPSVYKKVYVEGKRIRDQKDLLLPEHEGHWDWLKSLKCFED